MFPQAQVLCTSSLVLLASGQSAFPPDTSWLCNSIPNSDYLFSLSFDQVVKQPGRHSSRLDRLTRPRVDCHAGPG